MTDWVKIQTFERIHQAELRKDILEKNDIPAVIINEKDSLFLVGEIELYVSKNNEKKAKALIDEFNGLTKINSFTELKPILIFQKILQENNIQTILKKKDDSRYILDNYELYVKNPDLELVIPYLTGEKLKDRKVVRICRKVRQTKIITDILAENLIETIIIKKKDSDFHLEEVKIYVKTGDFKKSKKILSELNGWIKIKKADKFTTIEIFEEKLAHNNIRAIINKKSKNKFELFIQAHKEEEAIDILNLTGEWVNVHNFGNIVRATYYRDSLLKNNIPAVIINEKDSSFLLGDIELHVEKVNYEKALEIIKEAKEIEE